MIKTICGFNVQTAGGKQHGWTVPIDFMQIPIGNEIEIMVHEVDKMTNQHTVLECYAIYAVNGKKIWQDESCTQDDINEIYDVVLKISE